MANTALPELRLRLPGTWWQVPLRDEASARASVLRLVERQAGKSDELAQARRDITRQLLAALENAIEGDGRAMHIALDVIEGLPLSASITVFLPPLGMTPAIGTSPTAVLDVLEQGLALTKEGQESGAPHRFVTAESGVLQTHRIRTLLVPGERSNDPATELPTLVAEYWMTIPGTKRVILLVCTSVFVELEQVMLDFFESIVAVSYWVHPAI